MAGLVPANHVLLGDTSEDVDARDKPGHDAGRLADTLERQAPEAQQASLPTKLRKRSLDFIVGCEFTGIDSRHSSVYDLQLLTGCNIFVAR